MPRTETKHTNTFTRPGEVTYILPEPPSPTVTIILPPKSTWTSGSHWHENHTEYLRVIQGAARVTIQNRTSTYRPSDGIITIPKFAVHEWSRVLDDDPDINDELIVREWTDPADGLKEVFFRNLNSVILGHTGKGWLGSVMFMLQLWTIFHRLDNWPVVLDGPFYTRWLLTHVVVGVGARLGAVCGLRAVYDEYTPRELIDRKSR
ncbi:hypothetical protein BDV37DRAFT_37087 [Aspergillus pseudonomiae]|uniref:Cupin 2 conserved barrel domain-containing protein n=1 Tax=Aspergillus pseudonomiae TaxID=1506151 RepID=A0A5N7CVI6_9EURO|nr:uncharacterized protein BDV37DRAFT_37087 [Aspergillus pseudonomiae]KAE8398151.1 hypothetical protein BDV37DRAFT_37087 [Aspergillus pseudonomiae]